MSRPFLSQVITDDSALGGSVIERSLRFNDGDTAYLERNVTSSSNRKTHTFSAWIKRCEFGDYHLIYTQGDNAGNEQFYMFFNNSDQIEMQQYDYPTNQGRLITTQKFRDPSAWYHIVMRVDTTNSTADDRFRIYVNGEQVTSFGTRTNPSQNLDTWINDTTYNFRIGLTGSNGMKMNGYMAEINFVDGLSLDPSSFGYTESQTGLWRSKRYEGTYGTNGFYLDFSDNSSTSALGIDKSPNGNDLTTNNFSVSSGKDGDSFIDTPSNNFSTLNPLVNSNTTQSLSDGNLTRSGGAKKCMATFEALNGKYYFEYKAEDGNGNHAIGVCQIDTDQRDRINTEAAAIFAANGEYKIENNSQTSGFAVWGNGAIISVAIDTTLATPKVWFAVNNSWQGASGDSGTFDPFGGYSLTAGKKYTFTVDHGSSSGSTTGTAFFGAHQGEFNYDPPSGFKTLSTKNLPPNVPSIIRPQKHFDTILYTGDGSSSNEVTGLEFKPDLVWMKGRTSMNHAIVDSVRGRASVLFPNSNSAEQTSSSSQDLVEFNDHGFVVGTPTRASSSNNNGTNIVAWCWKAGGAAVTNNDGSIASQVSVNEEAGFSIVTYTGDGSSGKTVGHGLDATPVISIRKKKDASSDWFVHHTLVDGSMDFLKLNSNTSNSNSSLSAFTSTTLPVDDNTNQYVSYCWHEVPGYSKFGSYIGNGSSEGVFVHLGFRPAWVMVKRYDGGGQGWNIFDNKRNTFNLVDEFLIANSSNAEATGSALNLDFLSNGIKFRGSDGGSNYSGYNYIYMAFAEQPGTTPFETFPNAR
tara:strand:+ start:72 stop:2474 length:2403 start_codon:yes stop_codon:yes gene_type:complete